MKPETRNQSRAERRTAGKPETLILGSGFGGSLLALGLHRQGMRVAVVDRGAHPRFAIGESSTPLANLLLAEHARRYDLPNVRPFAKWGTWQAYAPEVPVGLKRGFSFYFHTPGQPFAPRADRANELLVSSSRTEAEGDTHWFREAFDARLAAAVRDAGIPLLENTDAKLEKRPAGWRVTLAVANGTQTLDVPFVVDATGAGVVPQALGLGTRPVRTQSWAVYGHFRDVKRWQPTLPASHTAPYPFPADDAALHHVLPDGWVWTLRFNNGITSVGRVFTTPPPSDRSADACWHDTLATYPSLAHVFADATPVRPLVRTGRLQRRWAQTAGPDWALLPSTAYFVDPLMSTGIAHTLTGVERLAAALPATDRADALATYDADLHREAEFVDDLISGLFGQFTRPALFNAFAMYYFAGAIACEHRRMTAASTPDDGFLFTGNTAFRSAVARARMALDTAPDPAAFAARVAADIAPINVAGLCDQARQNLYPYI